MSDPSGLQYLLTLVGGSLEYIRSMSPRRRPDSVTHHHPEADHDAYLERPFLEAQAALRARREPSGRPASQGAASLRAGPVGRFCRRAGTPGLVAARQ